LISTWVFIDKLHPLVAFISDDNIQGSLGKSNYFFINVCSRYS